LVFVPEVTIVTIPSGTINHKRAPTSTNCFVQLVMGMPE
jgi:hypothetical protein